MLKKTKIGSLLIALLTLIPIQSVWGQDSQQMAIRFGETKHHFDTLEQGTTYKHGFHFTNAGSRPLLINRVTNSCRCLTPDWPSEAISPGDTGVIDVTYFPDNRPGAFFKSIQVHTNVAPQPLQLLYVGGYVRPKQE